MTPQDADYEVALQRAAAIILKLRGCAENEIDDAIIRSLIDNELREGAALAAAPPPDWPGEKNEDARNRSVGQRRDRVSVVPFVGDSSHGSGVADAVRDLYRRNMSSVPNPERYGNLPEGAWSPFDQGYTQAVNDVLGLLINTAAAAPQHSFAVDDGVCVETSTGPKGAAVSACQTAPPNAWQPIESAPKDGSWFLGWNCDCGCFVWRDGTGLITGEDPAPTHWMSIPRSPDVSRESK